MARGKRNVARSNAFSSVQKARAGGKLRRGGRRNELAEEF